MVEQIIEYVVNDPIGTTVEIIVLACVFGGIAVLIHKIYKKLRKK